MATTNLGTDGHEAVEDVGVDSANNDTLDAGHTVAIVYKDTEPTSELLAALELCKAALLQTLP